MPFGELVDVSAMWRNISPSPASIIRRHSEAYHGAPVNYAELTMEDRLAEELARYKGGFIIPRVWSVAVNPGARKAI